MSTALCLVLSLVGAPCESALCTNGHPVKRSAHISYGGLPPRPNYARDHIVPLCLGGLDDLSNLQYQPLDEAAIKDAEERSTCRAFCRGEISLLQAQARFRDWHPRR